MIVRVSSGEQDTKERDSETESGCSRKRNSGGEEVGEREWERVRARVRMSD